MNCSIHKNDGSIVKTHNILALLAAIFLASCATVPPEYRPPAPGLERFDMYQGQMFSMKNGTELRFEIGGPYGWENEILARARNPFSGENFSGRLMLLEKGSTSTSVVTNAWGAKTGEIQTSSGADNRIAKGIIKGDKGTIVSLIIETQRIYKNRPGGGAPFYYRGFGEGKDNNDNPYTIQFSGNFLLYWYKNGDELLKSTSLDLKPND